MNNKAIRFIKNFSYAITSNILSLLISTLIILIVPKLIGVEEYGYWQLYLFYSSYVGFLHFGWNDGIYLRYGGIEYSKLDKKLLNNQFYLLLMFQVILFIVGFVLLGKLSWDSDRLIIFRMSLVCMVLMNSSIMLQYLLQCTNRIKEYAMLTITDRLSYISLIIIFLSLGIRNFEIMLYADLIGKLISLLIGAYYCRDIIFNRGVGFKPPFKEAYINISIGIKLMLSNIASMLIIGIVRLGIEKNWNVETFGKVSLTLSISNLMMVFINAIGLIMFPILRRSEKNRLAELYKMLRDLLMLILFVTLIIFYPLRSLLILWLPDYADGLIYMAILFPISIYEGKMALLVNTYLKTLREEKAMLRLNSVTMILSIFMTIISTVIIKDLTFSVFTIIILLAFRSIIAEFYLSRLLKISIIKDIALENILTMIFIFSAWKMDDWVGLIVYIFMFAIYFFIKKKDIFNTLTNIKMILRA